MRGKDCIGIDLPAVAVLHPPLNCREVFAIVAEIPVYAVVNLSLQRILYHLRRAEIHVSHPHRDAALGGHAIDRFHLIPFRAMRPAPLDDLVKIHVGLFDLVKTHADHS